MRNMGLSTDLLVARAARHLIERDLKRLANCLAGIRR